MFTLKGFGYFLSSKVGIFWGGICFPSEKSTSIVCNYPEKVPLQ